MVIHDPNFLKIVVKCIHHTGNHFKFYSSVAFITFPFLCNHYQVPGLLHHPPWKSCTHYSHTTPSSSPTGSHKLALSLGFSLFCTFPINGITQYVALCIWFLSLSKCFQSSSMLQHGSVLHSFLRANIPAYGCNTICLYIHPSMDIWGVSTFRPLGIVLLWISVYKFCLNTCFQFFWVYTKEWNCQVIW